MSTGIILMCFGKPQYGCLSFNMALSLKYHNPDLKIQLIYEREALKFLLEKRLWVFDIMTEIDPLHLYDITKKQVGIKTVETRKMNPGKMKTHIYPYLTFDNNLFIDSDSCCIKPLAPFLNDLEAKEGYYFSQVVGTHTKAQGPDFKAMQWAWAVNSIDGRGNPTFGAWEHYKLKDDAIMPAVNSSISFIKKGKKAEALFKKIRHAYDHALPLNKLRSTWGNSQPDELAVNVACAQAGINPDFGSTPMLFMHGERIKSWDEVVKKFYFLGVYGGKGFTHMSVVQYYDRLIHKYSVELLKVNQEFKMHQLIHAKHANGHN